MAIEFTSSGRSARDATVRDLQTAINEMNAAIEELSRTKGIGAELYINKLRDRIETYTNIKNILSRIG